MRKMALILILLLVLPLIAPLVPVTASPEVAPLAVIKVLDTGLGTSTYMAHFLSDELLMVATGHGDASLDGKYVSSYGNIFIYRYEGGAWRLIKNLTGPGVWRISDWSKVWSNSGYFSGDGKYLLEDLWSGAYGTSARVVELATGSTRPIDFSGLPSTDFYPCQISYDGTYIAAGTKSGDVYVWRWNGTYYQRIFTYHIGGDIRRLHMTLDGKYLIVGALGVNTLYIFQRSGDTYTILSTVQLNDGVGALGISDPWRIGLIAVGGDSGWIYVINASDPAHPKLIHASKPGSDRFYNPFYDRWIPKNVAVLAFKDTGSVGVIYDIYANATIVLSEQGKAASVSPSGTWAFVGDGIYLVVSRDPQSGNPRVRFWGTYRFERFGHDLDTPITLSPPKGREWHAYFFGGTLRVTKLFTESIPSVLVKDRDILEGRLGVLLEKGLVKGIKTVEIAGYVEMDKAVIEPSQDPKGNFDEEHTVAFARMHVVKALYGWNGHGFSGSSVGSAVVIDVPFEAPVSVYSDLKLEQSLAIVTVAPVFDWKNELLGILGVPIIAGGTSLAFAKYGAERAAERLLLWLAQKYPDVHSTIMGRPGIWEMTLDDFIKKVGGAEGLAKTLGRASIILAIAVIADSLYGVYSKYVTYSSVRTVLITAPIVEDVGTGKKYSAVVFVLPTEEIANYAKEYEDHVKALLTPLGVEDVGVTWISWGVNWDEYRSLLEAGRLPTIDLKSAVETTIAAKYDIPISRLRIVGAKIIVETVVHGHVNLWQWITGGIKVPIMTIVSGAKIMPTGTVAGGRVITDPSEIATVLGNVSINGVEYSFTPTTEGAEASFSIPLGAEQLVVTFNKPGYFADVILEGDVVIKKDFTPIQDFGYEAALHYDWEDTLIRLDRIEFVDVPYKPVYLERSFIYAYGNFTHSIPSKYLVLNATTDDPNSPSGKRYTYVLSAKNAVLYFDPANGGMLQPCKRYVLRYFYREPPDVGINVYLNGTRITSTKARHASVVLKSTAEQDVSYVVIFRVKYLDGIKEVTLLEESASDTLHVRANGTALKAYNIEKYVDRAVQVMAENGTPAFVEITARITKATYNYRKENDERTVVYYPPPPLREAYGKPAKLDVYVYNPLNGTPIAGASVRVSNETHSFEQTTNATGWASFSLTAGLWKVEAGKAGYHPYSTDLYVYVNMTFSIPLVPETVPTPYPQPPVNDTVYPPIVYDNETYWWLSVQVTWKDGAPFHGALVTVINKTDGSVLFRQRTNGTGFVHFLIPNGTPVRVEVNATNPLNASQTYYEYRELNVTQHYWLVFTLPWYSELYAPEVMLTSLQVVIHRGQGYYFGNVSHLVMMGIWTNRPQSVTVFLELVDSSTNQTIASKTLTIELAEGLNVNMTWFEVNASRGLHVRAHANITAFEEDTDLNNNELWSDEVFLKPFVDLHVFVVWRPVRQKLSHALLPEDVIEIDIGMHTPINLTTKPARLRYSVRAFDVKTLRWNVTREAVEDIKTVVSGIVWRNFTVTVPWSNRLTINVSVEHEWEDYAPNNAINLTIDVFPDVALEKVEIGALGIVREGTTFKAKFYIKSNVPEEQGARLFLSIYDNSTQELGGRVSVVVKPEAVYEFTGAVPENPKIFWELRAPFTTHTMTAMLAGYDVYVNNNQKSFTMTVLSLQFLWLIAIVVVIAVIFTVVRAVLHTSEYIREHYKFVRRKRRFFGAYTHRSEGEERKRFVRRKE